MGGEMHDGLRFKLTEGPQKSFSVGQFALDERSLLHRPAVAHGKIVKGDWIKTEPDRLLNRVASDVTGSAGN